MDTDALPDPSASPPRDRVERRASALLLLFVLLVVGSVLFVLYARGQWENRRR